MNSDDGRIETKTKTKKKTPPGFFFVPSGSVKYFFRDED